MLETHAFFYIATLCMAFDISCTCMPLYRYDFRALFLSLLSHRRNTRDQEGAPRDRSTRIYPVDTFVFNDYLRAEKSEFLQIFTARARYSSTHYLRTRMCLQINTCMRDNILGVDEQSNFPQLHEDFCVTELF